MLSFKNRFHGLASLRFVYRNGNTVGSSHFRLRYSINPRSTNPKVSVVVSKKVHKSAVGRNRIRRRIFAAMRPQIAFLRPGSSIIVTVDRGEVLSLDFRTIEEEMKSLIRQANLYK